MQKKPKIVYALKQTGKRKSLFSDSRRNALMPGKRISKNGKTYWETRLNRSDKRGTVL